MPGRPGITSYLKALFGVFAIGGVAVLGGVTLQLILGSPSPNTSTETIAAASVETIAPEKLVTRAGSNTVYARNYMMVAAHPVAAQVGAAILADGGSASDAIIAAQMVLNLVEPQSSGIGGGGFLLVWDAAKQELYSYDGRETAPAASDGSYVTDKDGKFRPFMEVVTGGASVGVPGIVRMLEMAHNRHGTLPWSSLFDPAIALAEDGFPVSPRLNGLLQSAPFLKDMEPAASYFYDPETGEPRAVGDILHNPALADTFRAIARGGADAFYTGPLAEAMVAAVQGASRNPGHLSLDDLAGYQAKQRDNLCLHYRIYRVCGMAPPSSGGSTVLQILGLLEYGPRAIGNLPPLSSDSIAIFGEAMRLAFADRDRFLADTDFVDVPLAEMLTVPYLTRRAALMDFTDGEKTRQEPGNPLDEQAFAPNALDDSPELPSTSHLVAVDRNGSVASMTTSIETGFGSRLMVGGFLLNNQLTDFAWSQERDGVPIANRYEPGKRPRSSMAPTLVFGPEGEPRLAIGSPGGSRIIGYVAQAIVGVLDWELSVQEAIDMPHFLNRNGSMELEQVPELDWAAEALAGKGYQVSRRDMASGLHGVEMSGGLLIGGADPRREGLAVGEDNLNRDLDAVFSSLIPGE